MSTVNVNLKHCINEHAHGDHCPDGGAPVEVHCSIPPTVTLKVRLGECRCPSWMGDDGWEHRADCPARSIEVTCTIGGDGTWAGSEVTDARVYPRETLAMVSTYDMPRVLSACRVCWALLKALVLGERYSLANRPGSESVAAVYRLFAQRDDVFSEIAGKVREEESSSAIKQRLCKACPEIFPKSGVSVPYPERRESAAFLAAYVARLIEQVGSLT